ncbi:MAG TPA: restriction endonuclease [Streptosporangiaceae bacterium]|nr:restriction endonuclease [Streptosporangiaceae bacterium]
MHDEARIARPTAQYPPADITPKQFEDFVASLLGAAEPIVDNLLVTLHEKIVVADGTYDFDATVRYDFAGMSFLVLVEAKKHKNAIKHELVQILHQKVGSVGGHKGVMISNGTISKRCSSLCQRTRHCAGDGDGRSIHIRDQGRDTGPANVT